MAAASGRILPRRGESLLQDCYAFREFSSRSSNRCLALRIASEENFALLKAMLAMFLDTAKKALVKAEEVDKPA